MPTVLRRGLCRFFFYGSDRDEPPHVHVQREKMVAKFWLVPVRLERSGGFRRQELTSIRRLVEANQADLLRSWDDFFHE